MMTTTATEHADAATTGLFNSRPICTVLPSSSWEHPFSRQLSKAEKVPLAVGRFFSGDRWGTAYFRHASSVCLWFFECGWIANVSSSSQNQRAWIIYQVRKKGNKYFPLFLRALFASFLRLENSAVAQLNFSGVSNLNILRFKALAAGEISPDFFAGNSEQKHLSPVGNFGTFSQVLHHFWERAKKKRD